MGAIERRPPAGELWQGAALAGLALGCYLVLALRFIAANDFARDDQLDYLRLAAEIRESGGISGLWRGLWTGSFTEANRHPLYLGILSTVTHFTAAKWQSALLGVIALAALGRFTARRDGWPGTMASTSTCAFRPLRSITAKAS